MRDTNVFRTAVFSTSNFHLIKSFETFSRVHVEPPVEKVPSLIDENGWPLTKSPVIDDELLRFIFYQWINSLK